MSLQKLLQNNNVEQPSSWEEASALAVNDMFNIANEFKQDGVVNTWHTTSTHRRNNNFWVGLHLKITPYPLANIKNIIDLCIDQELWKSDPQRYLGTENYSIMGDNRNLHSLLWGMIGASAILHCWNNDVELTEQEMATTLVKKQKDYGPKNISRFGLNGLTIRTHDKVARLENLLSKPMGVTNAVPNESIYDTLLDIGGYSAIGVMWIRNQFLIPLKDIK
jgi:hypothetical protein